MNLTRISQASLKVTERFDCISHSQLALWVMVMNPDFESVGCEFKYKKFHFLKKKT